MTILFLQTAKDYQVEYDRRRGIEYSRFHGYTYDGKTSKDCCQKLFSREEFRKSIIVMFHRNLGDGPSHSDRRTTSEVKAQGEDCTGLPISR